MKRTARQLMERQIQDKKSFFISDLHLFARRSTAPSLDAAIQAAARQSHSFVLGGDIFDFRWSSHRVLEDAIRHSRQWLERLVAENTACRFYYLLGNHDCHPQFVESLQELTETFPHLEWHRHYVRIDQNIFLHGDIVDTPVRPGLPHHEILDARRLAKENRRPPHPFSHTLYDAAVRTRMHRVVMTLARRNELVLKRLTRYLESRGETVASGIENVYFGHTHRQMLAVPFQGMEFHNPGAAIKGLPFRILETRVREAGPVK